MQFLLLLSALLSAMTGGLSSARGEGIRVDQAEAQVLAPTLAPQRAAAQVARPVQTCIPIGQITQAFRSAEAPAPVRAPLASVCLIE